MKKKRRAILLGIGTAALVYVVLLMIILKAESSHAGSSIHSLGDAFWYSVVTLTTVGYGDVSPVSPVGRLVGLIFLLMSTGVLVALVGTFMSFITGTGLPMLLLRFLRKREWYFFVDNGIESTILAGKIYKEKSDAVIIFGSREEGTDKHPGFPCIFLEATPEQLAYLKKGIGPRCKVFFMKENEIAFDPRALDIAELPVEVYAHTTCGQDLMGGNVHLFHAQDCTAREYWRSNPLTRAEKRIVLIGFGNYGRAMMKRAIVTNVFTMDHPVAYHIFGGGENFLRVHNQLEQIFAINEESSERDSLIFHTNSWTEEHELLAKAERIIVCEDNEDDGWMVFNQIQRYYVTSGRIDVRTNRSAPGLSYYGTDEELFTPEHILRTRLNKTAMLLNDLYRKEHGENALEWDQLDYVTKQSKIAAADHMAVKVRILLDNDNLVRLDKRRITKAHLLYQEDRQDPVKRERFRQIEHMRWRRFYTYFNWTYGTVNNNEKRQNPSMVPYEELPPESLTFFDRAWELISELVPDE